MKEIILIFAILYLNCLSLKAKDYVIESQGKRVLIKEHIYSKKDSLKVFKLEGTFKDNAGNFGEFNSIVNVKIVNNIVASLDASNEFFYNKNTKAYNIAIRENYELEQGVGKWYFNYATKDINAIINSECFYSIRYYKDKYLTLAKCNISEKAFEQIKSIKQ